MEKDSAWNCAPDSDISKTVKRFLITTADERSWLTDRPVLFLGEWCRRYGRKQVWEGMDATVAEPYGLQVGQKERDLAYIQALSSQLLGEVADELNAFHNTRHSLRYWNIVLGPWLKRYVETAFNRYSTLEQALKDHEVSGTTVFNSTDYSLATNDSLAYIWACNDDIWNHVFYAKILNFWGNVKTEMDFVPLQGISGFVQEENCKAAWRPTAKRFILNAANTILPKFIRKRDAFIVSSCLPFKEEIKLQLSLGQCPQLWRSPSLKNFVPVPAKRQRFSVDAESYNGFEQFVRRQLADIIPTCYLEGYDQLVQQVKSLPWPAEPRFIFTSNNYSTDEIFKVWAGSKAEEGVPYFTGQHGNNYGTHFYYGNLNSPERSTSDKFFTWGWSDGSPNVVPAFNLKTAGQKSNRFDPEGGLLLIEVCPPHRIAPWDRYFEFGIYQEEQFRFAVALPEAIQKKLTVRFHAEYKKREWSDKQRWKDRSPHTQIESGVANIRELIAQSRLVVHSYDSTGMLETLALNIPTMCFWQGGLDHLLPSAKPYYELLRSAGILLDTPEQAAKFVSSNWNSMAEWWENPKTQHARKAFCQQYARTDKTPVFTLRRLLTKMEAEHSSKYPRQ